MKTALIYGVSGRSHRSAASIGEMWALERIQQIDLDVEDTNAIARYNPNALQNACGECKLGAA
jgi:hypothetical protein